MTVLKILNKETGEYEKVGIGGRGKAATIRVGTVTTGEPGTEAAVVNEGTDNDAVLSFVIPRGDQGEQGEGASTASEVRIEDKGNNFKAKNVEDALTEVADLASKAELQAWSAFNTADDAFERADDTFGMLVTCEDFYVSLGDMKMRLEKDDEVSQGSSRPVCSGAVYAKIEKEIGNINALLATI